MTFFLFLQQMKTEKAKVRIEGKQCNGINQKEKIYVNEKLKKVKVRIEGMTV